MPRWVLGFLLLLPAYTWAVGPQVPATCRLQWTAPTENTLGGPLTDLASYQIFHARTPGGYPALPQATALASATEVPCRLFGADSVGQHYVAMKAVNSHGTTSAMSQELAFEIVEAVTPPCPPTGVQVFEFQGTLTGTMTPKPAGEQP